MAGWMVVVVGVIMGSSDHLFLQEFDPYIPYVK
jgi:hypothetical protein